MQKLTALLVIVGGVLAMGIALSFYGNHIIFEDMIKDEGDISVGNELRVPAELEESDSQIGIYAIQMIDYSGSGVTVSVLDPYGIQIVSELVSDEMLEGRFAVNSDGVYELVVKNDRTDSVRVFGVIGPEPDAGKRSLGFISLYMLAIGLIGMAGVGIFAIKKRKSA